MGVGRPPGRHDSHPGKSSRAWGRDRLSISMATQTNQQHSWGGLRAVAGPTQASEAEGGKSQPQPGRSLVPGSPLAAPKPHQLAPPAPVIHVSLAPHLRPRDQLPPLPRSRRYSGDSDSSASSAQSGPMGARSDDSATGSRRERPNHRLTSGLTASPRRPPTPRSQSRDRLDRGRPRMALGGRGAQPSASSPARRTRSQNREEQAVLVVRRDRDGQHSWVARGRGGGGSGGSGKSTPQTPRARSPAAPRPSRGPSPGPELAATPASIFRSPMQLDPQQEQQLFRRLEEEFLANARALEAAASHTLMGSAPDPPAPDSAYCSSSSSSSSLSVLGGKCGQPRESGRTANGLPAPRSQALSSSSDEGSPCLAVGRTLDAARSSLAGPEPSLTWARGRMDTQPDRKPSRIPTPRGPRRPSGPTELGAWHTLHSVTPRTEPDSSM